MVQLTKLHEPTQPQPLRSERAKLSRLHQLRCRQTVRKLYPSVLLECLVALVVVINIDSLGVGVMALNLVSLGAPGRASSSAVMLPIRAASRRATRTTPLLLSMLGGVQAEASSSINQSKANTLQSVSKLYYLNSFPLQRALSTKTHAASNDIGENNASSTKAVVVDISSLRRLVESATSLHSKNISSLSYEQLCARLEDLEREASDPSFWDKSTAEQSKRNAVVTAEISKYSRRKMEMEQWVEWKDECESALSLLEEMLDGPGGHGSPEDDEMLLLISEECHSSATNLLQSSLQYELTSLLSGEYDHFPARVLLTAGAGGTEACDWVNMLCRMYTRHAQHMGYTVTMLEHSDGDVVGYKSVELLIENGPGLAYGWFRGEKGAHRLVRLSPFNSNNKRQTTFAGVDVVPVLEEEQIHDITLSEAELDITTMKSGGKGGQNVNKVETGVRIRHIPTGLSVKCTQERSQSMNKSLALSRLKAQLLAIAQEQQVKNIQAIRGEVVEAGWGAQIRNYVMQPYKLVKDGRSGWESSDVDGILGGGGVLEDCVGSLLRWRASEQEKNEEMDG